MQDVSCAEREALLRDDVARHMENREKYGEFYDAFSEESPAYTSQRFTDELGELLKKGGKN